MMTYEEKLKIANFYLLPIAGFEWDDLADINSLHDCETKENIIEHCDDRLRETIFPFEIDNLLN